jgi:hypothetical protein
MLIERQYCGLQRRYRFEQRYRDERHVVIRLELSAGGSEHDTLIGSRMVLVESTGRCQV